jgi:hypothetical protein
MLSAGAGYAYPVSNCTLGIDSDHFSCNFYPTNASGNLATDSGLISQPAGADPAGVGAGYIIFLDSGTPLDSLHESNQSYWDEVVWFVGDLSLGGASNEFEVFTGAAMPSYTTVQAYNGGGDDEFLDQNANGIYVLTPTNHVYTVYDVLATQQIVPEPATFGLIAVCVIGLFVMRARSVRRRIS